MALSLCATGGNIVDREIEKAQEALWVFCSKPGAISQDVSADLSLNTAVYTEWEADKGRTVYQDC